MKWGRASGSFGDMQERLAVLEDALARLATDMEAVEERRLMLVSLIDRRADEMAERLIGLMRRVEAMEGRLDDVRRTEGPVTEEQLTTALVPLKLEVAAIARQAAVDEEQTRRAYVELAVQVDRMKQGVR